MLTSCSHYVTLLTPDSCHVTMNTSVNPASGDNRLTSDFHHVTILTPDSHHVTMRTSFPLTSQCIRNAYVGFPSTSQSRSSHYTVYIRFPLTSQCIRNAYVGFSSTSQSCSRHNTYIRFQLTSQCLSYSASIPPPPPPPMPWQSQNHIYKPQPALHRAPPSPPSHTFPLAIPESHL